MSRNVRPLIGISAGDPAGIGPEVAVRGLALPEVYAACRPLLVCDPRFVEEAIRFCGLDLTVNPIESPSEGTYSLGTIDVLNLENVDFKTFRYGVVNPTTGKASFEYVKAVIEMALRGEIAATVTGPINKEAIHSAGYPYPGHTEIYADLTGVSDYTMMLVDDGFRVTHVSTHVSLREAIDRVKRPRVLKVIELSNEALLAFGLTRPRIAVCGLNPHCGEGGLFGTEDAEEIAPAIKDARSIGICVEGPIPADTVFPKMKGGQYDLVVAMYHDQGHIPTKLCGFKYDDRSKKWIGLSGVNITLGLPIVRTSVDHGTAFDRAGQGTANPESMVQAIFMAIHLAGSKRDSE